MVEYIKREDALNAIRKSPISNMSTRLFCIDAIADIPAADVRPVVTCADCKHNNACLTQAFVEEASRVPFDRNTFFCADGKRADDA